MNADYEAMMEQEVSVLDREQTVILGGVEGEEEEIELLKCIEWVTEQGLAEGELLYELADDNTLKWPSRVASMKNGSEGYDVGFKFRTDYVFSRTGVLACAGCHSA